MLNRSVVALIHMPNNKLSASTHWRLLVRTSAGWRPWFGMNANNEDDPGDVIATR